MKFVPSVDKFVYVSCYSYISIVRFKQRWVFTIVVRNKCSNRVIEEKQAILVRNCTSFHKNEKQLFDHVIYCGEQNVDFVAASNCKGFNLSTLGKKQMTSLAILALQFILNQYGLARLTVTKAVHQ